MIKMHKGGVHIEVEPMSLRRFLDAGYVKDEDVKPAEAEVQAEPEIVPEAPVEEPDEPKKSKGGK